MLCLYEMTCLFPLFKWHACKLAKLSACTAKCMTAINKISIFLCRMFTTLFVSAFWHGVAPGYYLTFLCVPLVVIAEVRMEKAVKPYLSPKFCYYYDWLSWFFHYRSMEYLGCGFMLLQLAPCWAAWKSVYFIGHIILLAFIIIPFFIPKKHTSDKKAREKLS